MSIGFLSCLPCPSQIQQAACSFKSRKAHKFTSTVCTGLMRGIYSALQLASFLEMTQAMSRQGKYTVEMHANHLDSVCSHDVCLVNALIRRWGRGRSVLVSFDEIRV